MITAPLPTEIGNVSLHNSISNGNNRVERGGETNVLQLKSYMEREAKKKKKFSYKTS